MDLVSSDKVVFVIILGFYEWIVMFFGFILFFSIFEWLMEFILVGFRFEICLIYLDDIIVYGKIFEEELKCLEEVFVCLFLLSL